MDIAELKAWKAQKMLQQITYPLDITSQKILQRYFISKISTFITSGGASGTPFGNALAEQDGKYIAFGIYSKFINCSASSATSKYTLGTDLVSAAQGVLSAGDFVTAFAPDPGDVPGGLSNGSGYFVVNVSGNTLQLSGTKGGTAITLTTNGTGQQYLLL